jgi:hypothetical protein
VLAGTHEHLPPALAAGQHPVGQRREQARPDQRGFSAARGADDADQTRADEVGYQLGNQPLPAEEELSVAGLEAGQAFVGADRRRRTVLQLLAGQALAGRQPHDLLGVLTQLPQVDHLIGELGVVHAQAAAAAGDLPSRLPHLLRRPCLRPVACDLVDQQRDAARALQHGIGRLPRCRLGPIDGKDLGDLIAVQRAEPSARSPTRVQPLNQSGKLSPGRLVAVDAEHQQPPGGGRSHNSGQRLQRRRLGQVQVVQDQQHRAIRPAGQQPGQALAEGHGGLPDAWHVPAGCAPAHQGLGERLQRIIRLWPTAAVQHPAALVVDLPGELGGQPGLAQAGPAGHQNHPAMAIGGPCPGGPQPGQLGRPAHKWRPDRLQRLRQRRARGPRSRRRQIQPRVLGQDRGMQPAQLRPGIDAQLLDQDRPGPLVGKERIGLPTRPVQRQQQLGPQPLPQRLVTDQPLQLGHQLPVPPQPQVGLEAILQGDQAQPGQPVSLGHHDVAVEELLEGLPPP